jgi:hypothetical protein
MKGVRAGFSGMLYSVRVLPAAYGRLPPLHHCAQHTATSRPDALHFATAI